VLPPRRAPSRPCTRPPTTTCAPNRVGLGGRCEGEGRRCDHSPSVPSSINIFSVFVSGAGGLWHVSFSHPLIFFSLSPIKHFFSCCCLFLAFGLCYYYYYHGLLIELVYFFVVVIVCFCFFLINLDFISGVLILLVLISFNYLEFAFFIVKGVLYHLVHSFGVLIINFLCIFWRPQKENVYFLFVFYFLFFSLSLLPSKA